MKAVGADECLNLRVGGCHGLCQCGATREVAPQNIVSNKGGDGVSAAANGMSGGGVHGLILVGVRELATVPTLEVGQNEVISSAINTVTERNILGFLPNWDYSWNGWMGFTENESPIIQTIDDGIVVAARGQQSFVCIGPVRKYFPVKLQSVLGR